MYSDPLGRSYVEPIIVDDEDQEASIVVEQTTFLIDPQQFDPDPRPFPTPPPYSLIPDLASGFGNMSFNARNGNFQVTGVPAVIGGVLMLASMFGGRSDDAAIRAANQRVETATKRENEAKEAAKRSQQKEKAAAKRADEAVESEERERDARKEADQRAEAAAKEKEEVDQKLKLEQELRKAGIEPDRQVDDEEIRMARISMGYVNGCMNIGVVGRQNEGKSTLVNCFRGVSHGSKGSAKIGEAEVVITPTPYKDEKHPGYVWHDVPGGGTKNFSAWGYYFNQRLFAYDKLILVHTSTLSELDLNILKIGKYRNQECIVVRTKADDHIRNCKRRNNHATVEDARADFIHQVRQDTEVKNASMSGVDALRPDYIDYIISEMGLAQLINGTGMSEDPCEQVIDEAMLLRKLGL